MVRARAVAQIGRIPLFELKLSVSLSKDHVRLIVVMLVMLL